jgi:hypothetical protein
MRSLYQFSPATKQFIKAAWKLQKKAPWDFLHSYVYARWPYLYISFAKGAKESIHSIRD